MKYKILLSLALGIFLTSCISAGNLSLFPNNINYASSDIFYQFNFSNSTNCNPENSILSYEKVVTFNSRGVGYVSINISNISQIPISLCEFQHASYELRKNHSFSDIIFNTVFAQNLNLSGNAKINGSVDVTGNVTTSTGFFSWLGNLANRVTELFVQDINFNGTINGSGNISIEGYYSGQPLDGSIGSGIINSSSNTLDCGCVDITDDGVLDVTYPNMVIKIWNYGTNIYCDIPGASPTVSNTAHTVYYVDSACSVQTETWDNYFGDDLNPADKARLFDVYAVGGDIEILKGGSILGLVARKTKWNEVNCPGQGHLGVCNGMRVSRSPIFPEINLTSGNLKYVNSIHTSESRDSNPDGLHVTCYSDGSHTIETEIDIDKCDNGASCDACPDNKYRRYIIYSIGFDAHTKLHQLAPLDDDTFTTLSNCINTEKYPLNYTLPSIENGVAVPLAFYCGKRDDTAWTDGWVDIRLSGTGFGATPDLSGFVPYSEANQNVDLGLWNITASWFKGNINASYVQNNLWIEDSQESSLNVNRSNFWDNYDVPTDLNYRLLLYWVNITNRPTHLSNFTDNILWTTTFNTTGDSRWLGISDESDPLWSGNQSLVYLKSNPSGFWNATFALFNKTYGDTLYAPIGEPLWSGNQSLVYLKSNPFSFINISTASNLNYRLLLYWANITNRPTHLSNFTDNILWTAGFNSTGDARWLGISDESDPLWSGNFSNVAFKDTENLFTVNQTIDGYLNITGGILLENNATISRSGVGTKTWLSESGNWITQFS